MKNKLLLRLNIPFMWKGQVALCDYNDETGRANNLVSRAQEKRHVSRPERQVSRSRHEDRSGRQGQASSISSEIQVADSTRSGRMQRARRGGRLTAPGRAVFLVGEQVA